MLLILMLGLPRTVLVVGNIVSEGWDPEAYTEVCGGGGVVVGEPSINKKNI